MNDSKTLDSRIWVFRRILVYMDSFQKSDQRQYRNPGLMDFHGFSVLYKKLIYVNQGLPNLI